MTKTLLLGIAVFALTRAASSQQPATTTAPPAATAPAVAAAPPAQPGHYVGVASCANSGCHGATHPLNATRVLQNEYYTWLSKGRHAQAYNVLFSERSARIARNMRIKGKANDASLCLNCHSTNVPNALVSGRVDREDGVQCEACHGPASGWRDEHSQPGWTHEQSVARGMTDLRRIATRGDACLSCHMGNGNREVDHELIASGHPQLAFELDNYSESMPSHWNWNDTHGVRAWAVGQAVAFRDSLDNLSRHARGEKWPEFSDMSCYNCHHALKTSGWRQERGWEGRAGMPMWSPQRWAVLRLIVDKAAPQSRDQLDPLVAQLSQRVGRMNDPSGVASTADDARRIADAVVARVEATPWSEADVRSMINTIASDRDFIIRSDVHAAEQTALALQSLASVLTRRNAKLARGPLMQSIDALFADLKERDDFDAYRFADKMKNVKNAL
jgi:hypothetical protein